MSDKSKAWLGLGLGVLGGVAAAVIYLERIRPWHLQWGAKKEEVQSTYPGDDLILTPRIDATHAITIEAAPDDIWPWIAQIGQGRGGFYTYDWIENMMGLQIKSADQVLPQYQDVKVGDIIPLEPGGGGPPVLDVEKYHYLLLGGKMDAQTEGIFRVNDPTPGAYMSVTWLFYLDPVSNNQTRLIERFRVDWYPQNAKNWLMYHAFLEPGAFIMERGMLQGIKKRAEKLNQEKPGWVKGEIPL